jgi:hypothetical protein
LEFSCSLFVEGEHPRRAAIKAKYVIFFIST